MKRSDLLFLGALLALFLPFTLSERLLTLYFSLNAHHGLVVSFVKFALLATMGEALGLRIRLGVYSYKGFGLIPRALVWGFLGVAIKIAFMVFQSGSANMLSGLGFAANSSFEYRLLLAFTSSLLLNLIFAPVMMTLHKVTDIHILEKGGTVAGLFSHVDVGGILSGKVNWHIMWNFVFKRTIPFFWIPAHTVTFLLPPSFQVLFAAILGVILGVILAFAANKGR